MPTKKKSKPEDDDVFLTAMQLRARYSVSHMRLVRRLETDPTFPKPIRLSQRTRFWRRSEIEAWERSKAVNTRRKEAVDEFLTRSPR